MAVRTIDSYVRSQPRPVHYFRGRQSTPSFFGNVDKRAFSFSYPVPRNLRDVVKMSLFQTESTASVKWLWDEQYRLNRRVVSASADKGRFEIFRKNLGHCPFFIAPIRRGLGFLNLILQAQDQRHVMFTTLEKYKQRPEEAQALFIVTIFDDLLEDKDVALLRGDVLSAEISRADAEYLMSYLNAFYTDGDRFKWVEKFNHDASRFDFDDFLSRYKEYIPSTECSEQP